MNLWDKAVDFHGHSCPGLAMGFRAAREGMDRLNFLGRSEDEEVIAIVESESCAADGVQVVSGCTFGKGNLFLRDWGKQVYTFALRRDGQGIRLAVKPFDRAGKSREELMHHFLNAPAEELFNITRVKIDLPSGAKIFPTVTCSSCGEGVMEPRARFKEGKVVCPACAEPYHVPLTSLS